EELLAEQRPDLVVVATNGPSHAALTIAAAEAGARWVMCEKPMATSLRDARAMINSCAQHGTRLAINHTRRWSPAHQRFAAALAAGAIGEIRSVGLSLGAGRTGCNGSHMLDLTRLLTGAEFHSVSGWLDRTGTPDPRGPEYTDPGAHAVFHLNNGARCFLDQMEDLGVPPLVDLIGTVGRARVEDLRFYWELRARRPEDRDKGMAAYGCALQPVPFEVDDCPSLARWQQVQEAAYHNLLSDEPIACSGEDGYRAIEAVLAIHLSDRRGHSPVALPLQGEDLDFRVNFT
ncbi:MAG: Gfo/Idh/MocA family oxidoreductase, partial [Armatimonadetes bacterium]|nr:Gfo/Idh/MocA family oxidoreductase [Armatimonadota bacterium]